MPTTRRPSRRRSTRARSGKAAATPDVRTVAFVSLGCPKNLVDSEKMLGLLASDGIIPVADESDADAVIINTCGFLEASKIESIEEINRAAELKKAGVIQRIIVAGCLVQRHRAKMLEWCPDIDAMIGVFDRDRIVEAVRGDKKASNDIGVDLPVFSSIATNATLARKARHLDEKKDEGKGYFESDAARLRLTPRHYAYLRISEGCNQNCAFCTIPSIRGKMRSKPVERIIGEARELFDDGAFELSLIGQDTTSYGEDIGYAPGGPGLVGMLEALDREAAARGNAWIRLMYAYPSCFTDEMIDTIARLPRVLKYIDMPLQHINDRVLDSMKRRTSRKLIETLLKKLRGRIPGMAIRTTFISGYPGETQAEHDELVAFVRDFGFDAMGVFPYSPEPGTPAGTLHKNGGAIDDETIAARIEELMLTQQEVAFARNEKIAASNQELDVLIDEVAQTRGKKTTGVSKGGKLYIGRTYQQAPQIDSVTYVQSKQKLAPGELVRCKVTDAAEYDLVATPIEDAVNRVALPVI